MLPIAAFVGFVLAGRADHTIEEVTQTKLRDAVMVAHVVKGDQTELAKINRDFGAAYRVEFTDIQMKEPLMLRLTSKVDDMDVLYIINNTTQAYRIPKAHANVQRDLSDAPGRRQTAFDFGLVTPSLFTNLYVANFIRVDRETGDYVFDFLYKPVYADTTRSRVWIDPVKKYIAKREWYNRQGDLRAALYYDRPIEAAGIWFPSRLTVKNVDGIVAGVTQYESVKANVGLPDSLFKP